MYDENQPMKRMPVCDEEVKKKKKTENVPKFIVKPGPGQRAFADVSNLLLWIFSEKEGKMPSWIIVQNKHLVKKVVVLFLPGLDMETLRSHEEQAPFLLSLMKPSNCTLLLNKSNTHYSEAFATRKPKPIYKNFIEDYILTPDELTENGFITSQDFLNTTKILGQNKKILALDCEMVKCNEAFELARVTIIGENYEVLLDEYIKPDKEITDYLTEYSGITEEILSNVSQGFKEVQDKVLGIINEDVIVCGHSVENDLLHLKINHSKVIDTSVLYPHYVAGFKNSLKNLTRKFLKKSIQNGSHNSIEDACAALELTYLKISKGPHFGIPKTPMLNISEILSEEGKSVSFVDYTENFSIKDYESSCIVITAFKEIENDRKYDKRNENVPEILRNWDLRTKKMFGQCKKSTGVILATGIGDVGYAQYMSDLRDANFSTWTGEQEVVLGEVNSRLMKTFAAFVFPSQI